MTAVLLVVAAPARGQDLDDPVDLGPCPRVAVLALPGVTWADIERYEPPHLLRAVAQGSAGSMSVRTNTSRTSYASGFATMGGGARLDGPRSGVGTLVPEGGPLFHGNLPVSGLTEMRRLADEAGYGAVPGALARALDTPVVAVGNSDLGLPPPSPFGYGRWVLFAAMSPDGKVDAAATGTPLLRPDVTAPFGVVTDPGAIADAIEHGFAEAQCAVMFVDPGDLIRSDVASEIAGERDTPSFERALAAADDIAGHLMDALDPAEDLLLVASPTSPSWDEPRLGIAVAWGNGFPAGTTMESASTRRAGVVTLPDLAPTISDHLGHGIPASMNGRPWRAVGEPGDPVAAGIELDRRATTVDGLRSPVATGFVIVQVLLYGAAMYVLRGSGRPEAGVRRTLETGALAVAAFPAATFLAGLLPAALGSAVIFATVPIALALLAAVVAARLTRGPLDALLWIAGGTAAVLCLDLFFGGNLQMNTVFGYSPIVAGRFDGLGNIAFAILGASAVITGALVVHRSVTPRRSLAIVSAIFVLIVVFDGAPQLGGDVGGVLTLVPSLGVTFLLLTGRRPSAITITVVAVAAIVALGAFLALDLSRPPDRQTHLARTFDDIREQGPEPLVEVIERKARANLRVFRSTIWTYLVPPAVATLVYLLFRPRGRWRSLQDQYPKLRAGLTGGLVLAVVGFALNDSGIVIPAMVLSYLVPMTLLLQVSLAAPSDEPEPA